MSEVLLSVVPHLPCKVMEYCNFTFGSNFVLTLVATKTKVANVKHTISIKFYLD